MWLDYTLVFFILSVLTWAAVSDFKRRIIPNTVPITILILAFLSCLLPPDSVFSLPATQRLAGIFVTAAVLLIVSRKGGIGGGDFKLLSSLGALVGLGGVCLILALSLPPAIIWTKRHKTNSAPLAAFVAPGAALVLILKILL